MPFPDLEIRGGGWSSRPLDKGEGPSPKKLFSALRASGWSKNKVGGRGTGPPDPSPGSATDISPCKGIQDSFGF